MSAAVQGAIVTSKVRVAVAVPLVTVTESLTVTGGCPTAGRRTSRPASVSHEVSELFQATVVRLRSAATGSP